MKNKPFLILVIIWLSAIPIIMLVKTYISPHINTEKTVTPVVQENPDENFVVTYSESTDSAGAMGDYDATADYVFFSYSERTSVVEAYDFDGNFAFRLHFEGKKNGAIDIRCQDDLLYVKSKYTNIFVFDGDQLVRMMSYQEARAEGYGGAFFSERSNTVTQRWGRFYRLNEDGSLGSKINLPFHITVDFYKKMVPLLIIPILWIAVTIKEHRKRKARDGTLS